jgi:acetylornithine deacetylase
LKSESVKLKILKTIATLTQEAIVLLKALIATPSFSSEEEQTALLIEQWFQQNSIPFERENNNIWAYNQHFDAVKPTLLLNSHHDTVKPNQGYTNDPFEPIEKDGKLFGLGSNDAGGCLVALLATFVHFYAQENLPYNLVMVASAEEESSGKNGLNSVLKHLPEIDCAIVGEPTLMQLAIAEKGLLVLDVVVKGTASHAAHHNPDNPIYNAMPIISWFNSYQFEKISEVLGPVKMTVTQINAGKQHNVVPAECHLVVDIRVNDCYSNAEILDTIIPPTPQRGSKRFGGRSCCNTAFNALKCFIYSRFAPFSTSRNRVRSHHLRLSYAFGPIGVELPVVKTWSRRNPAVPLGRRIYLHQ